MKILILRIFIIFGVLTGGSSVSEAGNPEKFKKLLAESFPKLESARIFLNKVLYGHIENIKMGQNPSFLLEVKSSHTLVSLKDGILYLEEKSLIMDAEHKSQYPLQMLMMEEFGNFFLSYADPSQAQTAGLGPLEKYQLKYSYRNRLHNYLFVNQTKPSFIDSIEFRFFTDTKARSRLVGLILNFGPQKEYLINF